MSATDVPVLEARGLHVSYTTRAGEVPAVRDFDLTIRAGESVGLVGESGCGKSTVALAVMRHLGRNGRVVAGELRFLGRDLLAMDERQLRRVRGAGIAMVYQEPMASLNPSLTVGTQLVEVPVYHRGATRREARELALDMLAAVHLPDPARIFASYPHQLSGGQQQRVVIAMALLAGPRLLLLDEPTTALDVTVEAGIVELIGEIAERFDTSLLFISHNLGLVREACHRVAVMYAGEVVEEGPTERVFRHMHHPYTRGLFDSIPLAGTDRHRRPLRPIPGQLPPPAARPAGCAFGPRCRHFRAGVCDRPQSLRRVRGPVEHRVRCARFAELDLRTVPEERPLEPLPPGPPVLRVEGLCKHYEVDTGLFARLFRRVRVVKANEKVELEAREAETVAIVGESGCGKSTLAKVIMGLEEAADGRVLFEGRDIAHLPVRRRPKSLLARLQMVFQNPFETLNPSHTVGFQLARVLRRFGTIRGRKHARRRVEELLALVKLPPGFADRLPRQLSGGQKQRVAIARALAGAPALVVADEPVSALDVSVQAAIVRLLDELQRRHRTTLLFISHDLALVRYLADQVVVMYLGQVMESGPVTRVFAPPYHPYTEALLAAAPVADPAVEKRAVILAGDPPSPTAPPPGCPFHTRCPRRLGPICGEQPPPVRIFDDGHRIRCHLDPKTLRAIEPPVRVAAE